MKQLLALALLVLFCACKSTKQTASNTQTATNTFKKEAIAEIKTGNTDKTEVVVKKDSLVSNIETTTSTEKIPLPPLPPKSIKTETFSHQRWSNLLEKHVSISGNVDYKNFREDKISLAIYIDALTHAENIEDWSKEEKLAFWINAYNALTIDLIIKNYPVKSIKDIKNPWEQRLWQFGDKWYNLEDIEHKILRKMDEPRIHFAIVCASYSCPKLQNTAFTAGNLEQQLTLATQEFLSDTNRNEISENTLKLSKIFRWFDKDFEQNGSLIDFLNKYSNVTISAKAKISYKDYNWDLND